MATEWQLQEAKAKFSEVVNLALTEGPQTVTRRGEPAVVVVAESVFRDQQKALSGDQKSLLDVIRSCPDPEIFDLIEEDRRLNPDFGREVNLD